MAKKIEHISKEEILKLPVTTNRLMVSWNRETFFAKYGIVSYRMETRDRERKNLSYEQLSDTPSLSVVGIYAKYEPFSSRDGYTRFFVLVEKGDEKLVMESLKVQKDVACKSDDLYGYDEFLQQRIIVSLAINALGKKGKGGMMYNNGMLLVCDDQNFGVSKRLKELVCLKLEVNKYMNLAARTTSFSHPKDFKQLQAYSNCVFQVGKEMDGELWLGEYLKPVILKKLNEGDYRLDQVYIKKKRFSSSHNTIPYWPWNKDTYNHSRLFVICQVIENVNKLFDGMLTVDFSDHQVLDYFESHPKENVEKLLKEYFQGKTILVEDPFGTDDSKKQVDQFKASVLATMGNVVSVVKRGGKVDMLLKLCEEIGDETHYSQSVKRMYESGIAFQHMIHHGGGKEDDVPEAKATRILMELLVKDSIVKGCMPSEMAAIAGNWKFWLFKQKKEVVYGASLKLCEGKAMAFEPYGFDDGFGEDYDTFVASIMGLSALLKMKGNHDYHVMEKEGNAYLIIDTEEIPILDAKQIDDTYGKIIEGTDPDYKTICVFKRKGAGTNHKFLRGLMGFHLWKEEGLDGEGSESYSYISGYNSDNFNTGATFKIGKVPHVRRICILKKDHQERVWEDIQELKNMLAVGFGQWNELMTYPFPFKFLQEYLDNQSETTLSKHWSEM